MMKNKRIVKLLIAVFTVIAVSVAFMPTNNTYAASKHSMSKCKVKLSHVRYIYDGKPNKPKVTVTYNGKTLTKGKSYTVKYKHAVSPGTSYVIIKGKGNYTGTIKQPYKIVIGPVSNLKAKYNRAKKSGTKSDIQLTWKASKKCNYYIVSVTKNGEKFGKGSYKAKKNSFKLTNLGTKGNFEFAVKAVGGKTTKRYSKIRYTEVYAGKKKQEIEVAETDIKKRIGMEEFNLNASAKTALSYESGDDSIVTVSDDGTVSIQATGSTTIKITAATDKTYEAAKKVVNIEVKNLVAPSANVSAKSCRRNSVSWNKIAGADGYYVTETTTAKEYVVKGGENTTYDLIDRTAGKTYSYSVMAYTIVNGKTYKSAASSEVSCVTNSSRIGHAKSACGNYSAGDQSGNEVTTGKWEYSSSSNSWKKWGYVIRFKDEGSAEKLASNMEQACNNNNIGYDNKKNPDLENILKESGYSIKIAEITTPCETDCNTLIAACLNRIFKSTTVKTYGSWSKNVDSIVSTGQFEVYTDSKYVSSDKYLKRGDILMTNNGSHNHACVVL